MAEGVIKIDERAATLEDLNPTRKSRARESEGATALTENRRSTAARTFHV